MAAVEEFFSSVSLLLHFDGSNGATSFTDSSGTPKTITRNAVAQLDTAQKRFGTASCRFDGLGDSASAAIATATNLTTGDFTVELWVRPHVTVGNATLFMHSAAASSTPPVNGYPWRLHYDHAAQAFVFSGWTTGNANSFAIYSINPPADQTWCHVAGVRAGSTFYLFVDGELQGMATMPGTLISAAGAIYIGGIGNLSTGCDFLNGWIDELRMTKGVARYTANFTPLAVAFPNSNDLVGSIAAPAVIGAPALLASTLISGSVAAPTVLGAPAIVSRRWEPVERHFQAVSLLLHFDGTDGATTFTDSSSVGHVPVREIGSGAEIDTAQSKVGGAAAYFPVTTIGFDYIKIAHGPSLDLSSCDLTVELWVRLGALGNDAYFFTRSLPQVRLAYLASSGRLQFNAYDSGGSNAGTITASGITVAANTWYHLACVRQQRVFRFFVDGVLIGSVNFSDMLRTDANDLRIGASTGVAMWIDDLRVTKGVARYSANFTPPLIAHADANDMVGFIRAPAVLGQPALAAGTVAGGFIALGAVMGVPAIYGGQTNTGSILVPAVLGAPRLLGGTQVAWLTAPAVFGTVYIKGEHDFVDAVQGLPTRYNLDLVTPAGNVRVPMTSWQATLQTVNQCFARCVVPKADEWLEQLEAATAFIVYRSARLANGAELEAEVVTAPLETLQIDQGPTNHTASLSGYFDAYPANDDPDSRFDRRLTGIRSISTYESGVRVRCEVDWTLRPAQRAFYGAAAFIVSYMNLYATCYQDHAEAYMDVGERI